MLAADRLLLETNLRQSAIKLREKELNLYVENFSAMATQAAVFAGFTTTCLIEIHLPHPTATGQNADLYSYIAGMDVPRHLLHISAIVSICSNIICVSLSTITSIYGSGKALRGRDGSMDEAVDAMQSERRIIFRAFAVGLAMNLLTVLSACMLLIEPPVSYVAMGVVVFTSQFILRNATRIVKKFDLRGDKDVTRLDDLTLPRRPGEGGGESDIAAYAQEHEIVYGKKKAAQVSLRSGGGKQTV